MPKDHDCRDWPVRDYIDGQPTITCDRCFDPVDMNDWEPGFPVYTLNTLVARSMFSLKTEHSYSSADCGFCANETPHYKAAARWVPDVGWVVPSSKKTALVRSEKESTVTTTEEPPICRACENQHELLRCQVCGMTGPEIYEARVAAANDPAS